VPAIVEEVKSCLDAGLCVVIGLQTTGEVTHTHTHWRGRCCMLHLIFFIATATADNIFICTVVASV